jgi:GTPase SAR1 family protein
LTELIAFPKLKWLELDGNKDNNLKIPPELFSNYQDNCLEKLRGYFASLKKGHFQIKELPVILVGNSTAGKTSLRYFLQRNVFPPPEDHSTHGIEPSIWHPDDELLENFEEKDKLKDVQFYFWDFGGQEYYHATHRLFFSKKAIYILVWEQKTNKQAVENIPIRIRKANGEIEATELPVELFPYEYWFSSIRHYATDAKESPILLLQNKMDEAENDRKENPDPALIGKNNCEVLQMSIKKAYELNGKGKKDPFVDILLQKLFSAAKNLSSTMVYGALWEDIKKMLQGARQENIWSPEKFLQELKLLDPDVQENSMLSYALSLKAMGFIIYEHDDVFLKNYIFINPGWVTEMIYSILDYSVLENKGEFNKAQVIQKVGKEYPHVFIALMKKFELIFEDEELGIFIAPQYLPAVLTDQRKNNELKVRFDFDKPDFVLRFSDFMPRHIMLRFLAAYGQKAIGKYYWKNGIAFTLEKSSVLVLCDYTKKQFRVFTEDSNYYIQRLVFDKLAYLSENTATLKVSCGDNCFVDYINLQKACQLGNTKMESENEIIVQVSSFSHFFEDMQIVKRRRLKNNVMNSQTANVKIFISYAHVDDDIRKLFEERYLKAIQNHYAEDLEVWSDIKLKPAAGWDNKIKNEINAANVIIFFLSNGFLASNYINETEIQKALGRYRQKQQIIVPIYIEEISKKLLPFSDKQYLPGGKPLKEWRPRNKAWVKIQDGLITIIDDIKGGNTSEYFE